MNRNTWKLASKGLLFLGLLFGACNSGEFYFPHLVESRTMEGIIDTVTIRVSNMAEADSMITSNLGVGFSGIYNDPHIGLVQAKTFIEFNRTSDSEYDKFAKFDSVTLILRSNGNYYGDTLKHATFKVFRLLNQIEKHDDGYLYSTDTIPVDVPLADVKIKVKIKNVRNNEIEIKLPQSFGEELFKGILENKESYNSENYLKTFPGLSVSPGTESYCIHGLNLLQDSTACMIRIYYHVNTTYKEEKKMEFRANQYNSFYNLKNDKSNIKVQYNAKSDPVPSSKTDDMGIIMSGTPMYTRMEFPHLNDLLTLGQIVKIRQATLYVRPIRNSYDVVPLPPRLNIYYVDPTSNTLLGSATMPGGNNTPQNGNLPGNYQDMQFPEYPQYKFDVTNFIASQLGKTGYNKWALSLIIPDSERRNTIQRLVFGNQKYWFQNENQSRYCQIRLEVFYMVYND